MENHVLLLGRDPNFAWALKKIVENLGCSLEHVYTLAEAKFRMERFSYKLILLDGLRPEEIDGFLQFKPPKDKVVLFDVLPSELPGDDLVILAKGAPLQTVISFFKECLR